MPSSQIILILIGVIIAAGLTVFVAELVGALAFVALVALVVVAWIRRK